MSEKLKEIRLNEYNPRQPEIIFRFGDRFQAASFTKGSSKEHVVRQLRILADNIEHDELI